MILCSIDATETHLGKHLKDRNVDIIKEFEMLVKAPLLTSLKHYPGPGIDVIRHLNIG